MAPPDDGNEYLPFADLLALEKIDDFTYRSIALPFSPGGSGRAYGGHVYAQAAWAAAQTVPKGLVLHSVTGYFILAGLTTVPFVYTVKVVSDGKTFRTRIVTVTQAAGKGICFTCTCSFKLAEDSPLDAQEDIDLWKQYDILLRGKVPDDFPEAPDMDVLWYRKYREENNVNDHFPGLDSRKVEMEQYNKPLDPFSRRQLLFYRVLGSLDSSADPNLHACAHLYASDRNSLFIVARHFDVEEGFTQMASLSHTVVFHSPVKDMLMRTREGSGEDDRVWFCKEDWTTRAGGGRGMHHSRMIGRGGIHIATSWQDGMIRLSKEAFDHRKSFEEKFERQKKISRDAKL